MITALESYGMGTGGTIQATIVLELAFGDSLTRVQLFDQFHRVVLDQSFACMVGPNTYQLTGVPPIIPMQLPLNVLTSDCAGQLSPNVIHLADPSDPTAPTHLFCGILMTSVPMAACTRALSAYASAYGQWSRDCTLLHQDNNNVTLWSAIHTAFITAALTIAGILVLSHAVWWVALILTILMAACFAVAFVAAGELADAMSERNDELLVVNADSVTYTNAYAAALASCCSGVVTAPMSTVC